jgi:hypothetical protein
VLLFLFVTIRAGEFIIFWAIEVLSYFEISQCFKGKKYIILPLIASFCKIKDQLSSYSTIIIIIYYPTLPSVLLLIIAFSRSDFCLRQVTYLLKLMSINIIPVLAYNFIRKQQYYLIDSTVHLFLC